MQSDLDLYWLIKALTLYSIDTHFNASTQTAFENIVGKEEIAHNDQFLLFPQCFLLKQKIVSPFVNIHDILSLFAAVLEESKIGISGKRVNTVLNNKILAWSKVKAFANDKIKVL